MSKQPLVSIIIPIFNRANLICETLDSVLSQTYQNWECIVVDDGSTDDTAKVVHEYCVKDSRFQYYDRPIGRLPGGNAARNYGLDLSMGKYIMFLDSDDLLRLNCLEMRVQYFISFLNADFLVFQSQIFQNTKDDSFLIPNVLFKKTEDLKRFISFDYPWNISATLIKKDFLIFNKILWDEALKIHQDLDFYIRILLRSPNYKKIEAIPDVFIRIGANDKISNRKIDKTTLNSKYRFQKIIMSLLKESERNNDDYALRVYGLTLVNGKLFFKANNYILLLKSVKLHFVLGNIKYGLTLIPDTMYLVFKERIKYYKVRKILKGYEIIFSRIRFSYLPPVGSTLGKIELKDYLKSLDQ